MINQSEFHIKSKSNNSYIKKENLYLLKIYICNNNLINKLNIMFKTLKKNVILNDLF